MVSGVNFVQHVGQPGSSSVHKIGVLVYQLDSYLSVDNIEYRRHQKWQPKVGCWVG